ncbi:MAG: hypothetical protein JWO82_2528 [Akkermansiaceae bacterium]|nr:hypothetical protein [Akkermansiaceae bacterium]
MRPEMARNPNKQITLGNQALANRRKPRQTLKDALLTANARAHERTNRRLERGDWKSVQAAIAATHDDFGDAPGALVRISRLLLACLLMPLCWITTWTFLSQFTDATHQNFWTTTPAWYFCTGVLLMTGWFVTGLFRGSFLYFYVLGHELTHILFIWLFRGRVSDWGVSRDGGYVTTDKSNIVIALAPYFVPLWSALAVLLYAAAGYFWPFPPAAEKVIFGLTGFFWAFHLLWTLWMIPRDQPDLRENGTFLSLIIIYLTNLLLLSALMCLVSGTLGFHGFALEWTSNAAHFLDVVRVWWHQVT